MQCYPAGHCESANLSTSMQSFCRAWRRLLSYLMHGFKLQRIARLLPWCGGTPCGAKIRGKWDSSKRLQDMHSDFTALILWKRGMKAREVRKNQKDASGRQKATAGWLTSLKLPQLATSKDSHFKTSCLTCYCHGQFIAPLCVLSQFSA